jgi:hypothetical protein
MLDQDDGLHEADPYQFKESQTRGGQEMMVAEMVHLKEIEIEEWVKCMSDQIGKNTPEQCDRLENRFDR